MSHDAGGRVAVITGGASGIGLASAIRLATAGFRIALADLPGASLDHAAGMLGLPQSQVLLLPGDVREFDLAQRHAGHVIGTWGRVDVLVNSAGVSQPKPLLEITEEEFDFVIGVNLKGTFNWCKALASGMIAGGGGRIVNISSVNAHTGGSPSAVSKFAYAASKAGVLGLTRGLAQELAPLVAVSAICPGLIETQLTAGLIKARGSDVIEKVIPLGRIGRPDDVAVVVAFLATVEPNYITGEVVDVDGGAWIN